MGRSSMQGTPWHYEYLKSENEDTRRNRKKCIYYKNGMCEKKFIKCNSTIHCEDYRENKKYSTKKIIIGNTLLNKNKETTRQLRKMTNKEYVELFKSSGKKYKGYLTVKIENEQIKKYKTSEIPNDAIIFNEGYKYSVGERFELNGLSILVYKNKLEKVNENND